LFSIQKISNKFMLKRMLSFDKISYKMKNSISKIIVALVMLLTFSISNAQIKNTTTATVKIYGNCGTCEKTIEKAGNLKKVATVDWNKDTKMATLTYDATKTNQDEILKRIALAGYDSDSFLAPDDVYANLHGCCQYDREAKVAVTSEMNMGNHAMKMGDHKMHDKTAQEMTQKSNELQTVFDSYFGVKDALVQTDGTAASAKSTNLLSAINAVKMEQLEMDVHTVWMQVLTDLKADAKNIADAKDIAKQRNHFVTLSKNMYPLMTISKTETPTYYQFCPMANEGKGANWLSKENAVKNPYYGAMMLTCGKTVETIKK
jgi:copper chaperone CopZ